MKSFLEFLGRASVVLLLLYISIETFGDKLHYNWWYFAGMVMIIIWVYLPFIFEGFIQSLRSIRKRMVISK